MFVISEHKCITSDTASGEVVSELVPLSYGEEAGSAPKSRGMNC